MSLTEILSNGLSFFGEETWILQVFIVVFVTAMLNWMQKRIVKKIIPHLGIRLLKILKEKLSFLKYYNI